MYLMLLYKEKYEGFWIIQIGYNLRLEIVKPKYWKMWGRTFSFHWKFGSRLGITPDEFIGRLEKNPDKLLKGWIFNLIKKIND